MAVAKLKILIAEDDFVVAKNLEVALIEKGYHVVGIKPTGEEVLLSIANTLPDLIILDINLAGILDGITVAGQIKDKFAIPVLFLTSDRDRTTFEKAKLVHPAGYLIKPFDTDELVSAIELAIYSYTQTTPKQRTEHVEAMISDTHVFVKSKNRLEKVKFEDILYIEANDIYASLVARNQTYVLGHPLKTFEEKFPEKPFMRVHRSFIVNLNHIEAIEDNFIVIGKKNIPIGKTYRAELMNRLSIL